MGYHNTSHPNSWTMDLRQERLRIANLTTLLIKNLLQIEKTSDLFPTLWKPQTVQYPYERLEDMEPWLFVPGNYNGRIGVIWETCTACKLCVWRVQMTVCT